MAVDSKWEEASRCPKCKMPGNEVSTIPLPQARKRGAKGHIFVCENDRCERQGDRWIVQVNADGSIPERKPGQKEFPAPERLEVMGQRYLEMLEEETRRGETLGGL